MEAKGTAKQARIIRPLGRLEAYHSMLHHLGYLFGVVVSCRYTIPSALAGRSGSPGLRVLFETAVAQTVLEHPLLRVGLVGEGTKQPSWAELRRVDLTRHIQWRDIESPHDAHSFHQNIIPSQLNSRFSDLENQPGWRLAVLHDPEMRQLDVVFAWNHANTDGMGGRIFHESLLRNLNAREQGAHHLAAALDNNNRTLFLPAIIRDAFPPPQEQTAKYTVTPGYFLSSAWKEVRPPLLSRKITTQATWAPVRTSPFETRVRGFSVGSNDSVQKLLGACRENRTTLTGLTNAIVLVSLASQLDGKRAPAFAGGTALNMRRFSSQQGRRQVDPHKTVANFVSDVKHHFDAEETAEIRRVLQRASPPHCDDTATRDMVWRIAARVRGEIQAKLSTGTRDDIIGLMRFVGDWRQTINSLARNPRSLSWNVSNVGVLEGNASPPRDNSEGTAWECERAEFALGGEVTGAAFNIGMISVRGRGLSVAVSWQACAVEPGIGEQLVADMDSWMGALAKT